jgi:hypothetical protein
LTALRRRGIQIAMKRNGYDKDMELLDGNVQLRLDLIKKKIHGYFEDVERAMREGRAAPLPGDAPDSTARPPAGMDSVTPG